MRWDTSGTSSMHRVVSPCRSEEEEGLSGCGVKGGAEVKEKEGRSGGKGCEGEGMKGSEEMRG